ncbi:MAG TPA: hypothetical protein VJ385_12620, partial [Fibrobacteria bacterium]|nr:hypothetical protein [Fibrobacteria bacterium]
MDNESPDPRSPLSIPDPSPRVMRSAKIAFLMLLAGACVPARALVHSVTDFRQDSSALAGSTFRLDPGWGDSLLLLPESFRYATVKTVRLSDSIGRNGSAGGSPMVSAMGNYRFKVAYLAWDNPHDPLTGPTSKDAPPQANIVTRIIDLSPDTAAVDPQAYTIASLEVTANAPPPIAAFSYPHLPPPAPNFFNFAAEGETRYAAYWGSGTPSGPIRRATHKDTVPFLNKGQGTYVPSASAPTHARGFGKLSSALYPGSGGNKTVVAYEYKFGPDEFMIRWEDVAAGASDSLAVPCTAFPEDFAVAADSSGNTVVMWRQTANLFAAAFDNSHAQILATTLLQAGVAYDDSSKDHQFRPYAVTSMTRGNFLIAYASVTGTVSDIFTRTLALPIGPQAYSLGSPVAVSAGIHFGLFPDISVSEDRIVVGWFQRPGAGGARRLVGSVLPKSGTGFTLAGRTDLDFAGENITFTGMHANWSWAHWFRSANLALDGKGNVVAAYDSGTHAKVALVRNTPIYYDSAAFVSRSLKVENPAIPAFVFDPASDSVAFLPFRPVTNDSFKTLVKLAVSPDGDFTGAAYQAVPGPIKTAAGFYRYSVGLLTTKTGNPTTTNLTTPKLRSLDVGYNVKPALPAVDSLKRGAAPMEAYDSAAANPLLPRKDSLVLVCA